MYTTQDKFYLIVLHVMMAVGITLSSVCL